MQNVDRFGGEGGGVFAGRGGVSAVRGGGRDDGFAGEAVEMAEAGGGRQVKNAKNGLFWREIVTKRRSKKWLFEGLNVAF